MSKQPETIELSQEEQSALLERLTHNALTHEDRVLLGKCLNFMVWLQAQLQHAKISLDKLRKLFGIIFPDPRKRKPKKN